MMNENLELEAINKIMFYSTILRERGYDIKFKFWNTNPIELDGIDALDLKNQLRNSFYNLFETLLREGCAFNEYDLNSFGVLFGTTNMEFVEMLENFVQVAGRVLNKEKRSLEDEVDVKIIGVSMEQMRMNMLKYILQSLMDMTEKLHDGVIADEITQKYDDIFIIETLLYGGR